MKNSLILLLLVLSAATGFAQDKKEKVLMDQLAAARADTAKVRLLKELGSSFQRKDAELSREYAEKCLKLSLRTGNKDGEAGSYNIMGSYYYGKSDYVQAMDYYLKALRIYKDRDDKKMMSVIYNNLGGLNIKQRRFEEAKSNLKMAIRLKEEINNDKVANIYQNLASIYLLEGDNDKAIVYYKKSIQVARKTGDGHVESSALNGFASALYKKEKYREAIKVYYEAMKAIQKLEGDNRRSISGLYHNIGTCYCKVGDFDKAIVLLNESLRIAKEINSKEDIKQAYSGLSYYYKQKGDLANALIAEEYYSVYKDSVINESTLKAINELQEKYKSEERKKEIADLQSANGELEVKSTLQYSLLIVSMGALFLTVLAVFFYLKQVKAKQQRKQAELEQKALRAQMNPHFIFNSLNSIQRMYIEGKEDIANDYMADFSRLLRSILENSGKDLIRLKEELDVVKLYMDLETVRTDDSFEYSCEVAEEIDPLLVRIPPLIFQPYLENAIWHGIISKSGMGKIRLSIQNPQNGKLICQITDNGIGIHSSKKQKATSNPNKSMGMQITAERLGGEENVVVEELSTGGTRITLTIQYTV